MPWPLLFTSKRDINGFDIQTSTEINTKEKEEETDDHWCQLTIAENTSLLTSLHRVCVYWRQIVFSKVRFIITLVFVIIRDIVTRLTYFIRRRTSIRSPSTLSSVTTSPSIYPLEEDRNNSSTSLINFNSELDLSSLENSTMTHVLVQQQTHRTPNMSIHQTSSTKNENLIPTSHSVDEIFFYRPDSTSLFQFLQRFASEPHMSMCHSTSNGWVNNNSTDFTLSNSFLPVNESDCDKPEDVKNEQLDDTFKETLNDEVEEVTNTNSSTSIERHFRRRKRRSSLTRSNSLSDETEPIITDSIANQEEKTVENVQPISIESLQLNEINEKKEDDLVKNEESNETTTSPYRLRSRRLKYRSYRQTSSISEEPPSENTVESSLPTELPISTPPLSPISPTENVPLSNINPNTSTGNLKHTGTIGTTKKMVRFADSVGRELTQVQYILPSGIDDDLRDFSFGKKNLYIPKTLNFEYKPWSFDVALPSKELPDSRIPRRFFCLYRQPNSEHPDVYLHEIWKNQVKLEHADIRSKSSMTSEQYLHGTIWVTNGSYWKNVTIKYTFNRWINTYEYEGQYRCHSNDFRNIDQFEFNIDIPHDVDRIDFVIRYSFNGQEHWDNNDGKNYTLETESAYTPQTTISLPHDCDFNEMRFY